MQRKEKKRPSCEVRWIRLVLFGILLAAAIYLGSLLIRQEKTMRTQWQQLKNLNEELALIQENNALLREEIKYMDSDAFIERIAREKLGMVREGETLYLAEDAQTNPSAQTPQPAESMQPADGSQPNASAQPEMTQTPQN